MTDDSGFPTEPEEAIAWAMNRSPEIRDLHTLVGLLVALAPSPESGQPYCSACLWEFIVKPQASLVLGWGRGYPAEDANEPKDWWRPVDLSQPGDDRRTPAANPTEAWLRSSEAWDLLTNWWMAQLEAADPGNGHGMPQVETFRAVRDRAAEEAASAMEDER